MSKRVVPSRTPHEIIAPLWGGSRSVTMRTSDAQAVLLHYGADYLHMKEGHGYHLKTKRVGPGIHSMWLATPEAGREGER